MFFYYQRIISGLISVFIFYSIRNRFTFYLLTQMFFISQMRLTASISEGSHGLHKFHGFLIDGSQYIREIKR